MQRNRPVSKSFRERVLTLYPALATNTQWWGMFELLCFNAFYDKGNTEAQVIPWPLIKYAAGLDDPDTIEYREFNTTTFLEAFRLGVLPDMTLGCYEVAKSCRTVTKTGMSAEMLEALQQELLTFPEARERVRFISGEVVTDSAKKALRQVDMEAALSALGLAPCDASRRVIEYLNGLSPKGFTKKVNDNIGEAITVAAFQDTRLGRPRNMNLLHWITSQAQPFYGPSEKGHTVRVFAFGETMMQLKTEVREALIDGWHVFDLRNAQLAIIARDWNIPALASWLQDPSNNVWDELCSLFPSVPRAVAKPSIKDTVYALAYGGGKHLLVRTLTKGLGLNRRAVAHFWNHWLVKSVLDARERMVAKVVADEGAFDTFNRWIKCGSKDDAPSCLAQLSQSVELQLLLPVIDFAEQHPNEFAVMLWEHDGFTVNVYRRAEMWTQRICDLINAECLRLNVPTRLEVK